MSHGFFMVKFIPWVKKQLHLFANNGQQRALLREPARRGASWPMTLGPLHRNSGGASQNVFGALQCEAPKIAKLVYNSNNYGLWYL